MISMRHLWGLLAERRIGLGMLAEMTGMKVDKIRRIRKEGRCGLDDLYLICRALGVKDMNEVLSMEDDV